MVKLTDNLCPEFGLANGSRGVVRDIIYPGGVGYTSTVDLLKVRFFDHDSTGIRAHTPRELRHEY